MGGAESKIDVGEAVSRYKLRHQFMKEAVSSRNAFAAAQAAYTKSLKNTGAALSDYADSDFFHNSASFTATVSAASTAPPPPLTPPPPLPPPPIKIRQSRETVRAAKIEDEHEELEFEWIRKRRNKKRLKDVGWEIGRRGRNLVSFMYVFAVLDDYFLKSSECATVISMLLEATRMNFHLNFADNRGEIDHSKSVMDIITWNRSFQGMPGVDDDKGDVQGMPSVDDDKGNINAEETENHATLSDKMLAWEEKLYDEVKAGEVMKREYQNKVALLNKQVKRGSNGKSVEKLKASVCQLHASYIVDIQLVDAIVAEINHLRDDHLYPKLVQLVDRMAKMWGTMRDHHEIQLMFVYALKTLDHSHVRGETSAHHFERTIQLCEVVRDWHAQFCRLVDYQKDHVRALYNWLKLYPIPIESNSNLPIHELVIAWNDDLDKLPDEVARSAISNFSAVIQTIVYLQEEEMKQREKTEAARNELDRKGIQHELKHGICESDNPLAKVNKEPAVISLRRKLEEEQEQCQKICRQVGEKTLANLKQHMPELFRAMSEFALACSVTYNNLKSVAENE